MSAITPIVMPKWGLEMREGRISAWLVEEGARIAVGTPIVDVETDKISNAVEAPDPGLLRRRLAQPGDTLPVKALLGVLAEPEVSDAEIDAFVAAFEVPTAEAGDEEGSSAYAFAEIDGIRVRYARRGGDGGGEGATPALFIHGFGGDLDNWLFNLDTLAEAMPVIALDLPAHGQSTPRLPGASLRAMAGFVARFLDHVAVERVHAVGHSMGGAIAAQLALDHPARVATVTVIGSAGLGGEINGAYLEGFVAAASRRELKPVVEQLFADPSLVTRQLLDDLLKYKRLDGVSEALTALRELLFGGGRQAEAPVLELERSEVPLMVVWGAEDRIIPAAHAGHAPPGASVAVIAGAGHMVMMEKAGEVNALLRGHIRP